MLQLLSPLALVALAALALPAILHLWRPPAKTVRVGTLRFFTGPGLKRLNKLRWRERLLLAVRLLLLTLLALLLAQVIWRKAPPRTAQKWALREPGVELRDEAKTRWSELKVAGFQAREFPSGGTRDVWSWLREIDARLPAESQVAIFASPKIARLHGARPQLRNLEVEWIAASTPGEEERSWIESLRLSQEGELHLLVGRSSAVGTEFQRSTIPAAAGRTEPPLALEVEEERGFRARLVGGAESDGWVRAVKAKTIRVAVLHDAERGEDVRHVEAALRAIAETAGASFLFENNPATAEWIFWLNDQPPAAEVWEAVRDRGANLVSDGEPRGVSRRLQFTVRNEGAGRHWQIFGRFHPEWNELSRSSALPAVLRSIILPEAVERGGRGDARRADLTQVLPAAGDSAPAVRLTSEREPVHLHDILWLACAGLFLIERVLSHRGGATVETAHEKVPA